MSDIRFTPATRDDVSSIVALLADDQLGRGRETGEIDAYLAAFDAMATEGTNHLIVGRIGTEIVACYQITYITGLSLAAAKRAQIEGVRVAAPYRGQGLGADLMRDAERRARAAGCQLIQLTTNRARADAHRFYDRLGFTPSHIGYKKTL